MSKVPFSTLKKLKYKSPLGGGGEQPFSLSIKHLHQSIQIPSLLQEPVVNPENVPGV